MSYDEKNIEKQRNLFIQQIITHGQGKVKYLGQIQKKDVPIKQRKMYPKSESRFKLASEHHSFDFGHESPSILKVTFYDDFMDMSTAQSMVPALREFFV